MPQLQTEQVVQQAGETAEAAAAVQRVREAAEEVPEQLTVAGLSGNRQVDLIQVDHETQQVQVQRAEHQVENRAATGGRSGAADRQGDRDGVRAGDRADDVA